MTQEPLGRPQDWPEDQGRLDDELGYKMEMDQVEAGGGRHSRVFFRTNIFIYYYYYCLRQIEMQQCVP